MERSMTADEKMYVQYGCGLCAPNEWLNFDSSPTLRIEKIYGIGHFIRKNPHKFPRNVRFGDIICGLALPNNSADAVYASHVLEHFALEDLRKALDNTLNLLKPGGIFRFVVPDLGWTARQYVSSFEIGDAMAASTFVRRCHFGRERNPKTSIAKLSLLFGQSDHLWMWDEFSMRKALVDSGFGQVRRCEIGDSGDPMFDLVEDPGRFFDAGFPELAFEARKPA
jgi:predicted SAM-dependent methyltransferase